MKNTWRINSLFGLILFTLLFSIKSALAVQTFPNNLLKANFSKTTPKSIKLTLYTSKPYKETVFVNKKSNNLEYVILMPETSNSLTAKPPISNVSDVVKSIDVKTQQYGDKIKGYTKITITTSKPIEITSEIKTLNAALKESDYKELLSQKYNKTSVQAKKQSIKQPVTQKKESVKTAQTQIIKKQALAPVHKTVITGTKTITQPKTLKTQPKVVTKAVYPAKKVQTTTYKAKQPVKIIPTAVPTKQKIINPPQTESELTKVLQKKVGPSSKNINRAPLAPVSKNVTVQQPKVAHKTVSVPTQKPAPAVHPVSPKPAPAVRSEVKPVAVKTQSKPQPSVQPQPKPQPSAPVQPQPSSDIKPMTPPTPVVKPDIQPTAKVEEKPAVVQEPKPTEKVNEDNIKKPSMVNDIITKAKNELRKYKGMIKINDNLYTILGSILAASMLLFLIARKKLKRKTPGERATTPEMSNAYNQEGYPENFDNSQFAEGEAEWQEPQQEYFGSGQFQEYPGNEQIDENFPQQEFQEEFSEQDILNSLAQEEQIQETEISEIEAPVQEEPISYGPQLEPEETAISPFETLDSISEEIPFVQEAEPEQPIEIVEAPHEKMVFEDNIVIEDNLMQNEMPTAQDIENIFGEEEEEEEITGEQPLTTNVFPEEELPQVMPIAEEEISMIQELPEEIQSATPIRQETEIETKAGTGQETAGQELVTSEYQIDEQTGLYLVDFEDTTALVGHINQEFFVLKRFDDKVEGRLQVRLDEKKGKTRKFMTRVADFKALIEVNPSDMKLLIEL